MHGHRILPPGFDAAKKYPVLWYVYGGPHSQLVTDNVACRRRSLASLHGDGRLRGVSRRRPRNPEPGIAREQAIHRRLGTVEIDDQLAALDAVVERCPDVDGARVGVHGWSYGGDTTASLMCRAPKAFACGTSGAPVTGWDLYETGYGERYMDTPSENPEGYKTSDIRTWAKDLKGDLRIVPRDPRT
jgi:dipeptidyl-peptidase-4